MTTFQELPNEEYWQPELKCCNCMQRFMFAYTEVRREPRYCPWCGDFFTDKQLVREYMLGRRRNVNN